MRPGCCKQTLTGLQISHNYFLNLVDSFSSEYQQIQKAEAKNSPKRRILRRCDEKGGSHSHEAERSWLQISCLGQSKKAVRKIVPTKDKFPQKKGNIFC